MKEKGLKDNHALQTYFNQRLLTILKKHGKRMMGWDEIFQPDLPKDIVIHSWRGQKALAEAARQGYDGILSNGYYIDLIFPTAHHYLNDPLPDGHGLTDGRGRARPRRRGDDVERVGDARDRSTRASGRARPPSPSASGRRAR